MTDDSDRAHMHNFNEFVMEQRSRWDAVLLPVDNGMMLARKKM